MKNGWLIYTKYEAQRNEFFVNQLLQNAKNFDLNLSLILREKLSLVCSDQGLCLTCNGKKLNMPNFAILRTNDFALSFQLENMGVKVFNNAKTSLICNDKYLTYCFAKQLDIPVPHTILVEKTSDDWQTKEKTFFPSIAKPLNQKGGKDVMFLQNYDEFKKLSPNFADKFLLQRPAKNLGEDMRVYVLNKQVLACAKRQSTNDFRSNFCLGGNATLAKPTDQQVQIATTIAKSLDADYIGVDFLFDGKDILLNEVEDVVGARMIYTLTNINPAIELLKTISQKV